MSFGGNASSIAVQDALAEAYTYSVLVASAGNDGEPNEETDFYRKDKAEPNYPAALSSVLGVMSVGAGGVESTFTNWDAGAYNSVEYRSSPVYSVIVPVLLTSKPSLPQTRSIT